MDLANCEECGRAFAYQGVGPKKCEDCRQTEEEKFQQVKDYLWDNPNASVNEVHDETGVEKELIIKFVKQGRLVAEGLDVELTLECERCGKNISEGRFCEECQQELVDGFSDTSDSKKDKKEGRGMFLKDRINRRKKGGQDK